MQTSLQHRTGIVVRLWLASVVVLTSSSIARAQQPAAYVTSPAAGTPAGAYAPSAYSYQSAPSAYAPQYYQTSYAPQYYQTAYTAVAPQAMYNYQAQQTPYTQAAAASYGQAQPAAAAASGDSYGFLSWLNATRASYGLPSVGYDPNLESWASMNNGQQNARGMGHHVMGPARRQNSAMGSYSSVPSMWMASPAHRAALLDPTIRWIGIAGMGAYWTFNAY